MRQVMTLCVKELNANSQYSHGVMVDQYYCKIKKLTLYLEMIASEACKQIKL